MAGGGTDDSVGFFVQPTLLQVEDPAYRLDVRGDLRAGADGPRLSRRRGGARRSRWWTGPAPTRSPARSSPATGGRLPRRIGRSGTRPGNYYINDKPTGAVVGQQPFGGGRASGTNDKAGSILNLLRWVSPRSIKETLCPPKDYRYPFMEAE